MTKTAKKPLAFVLGTTANLAFAAGTLILGLGRHMTRQDYEILIISEDLIAPTAPIDQAAPSPEQTGVNQPCRGSANPSDSTAKNATSAPSSAGPLDAFLLSGLPKCRLLPYAPLFPGRDQLGEGYPGYYLYIFECFRLLEEYRTVIWLDCDMAVQGDLSPLANYGPFAMALQDNNFSREGVKYTLGRNFLTPVPGYDMEAEFCNSGVMVLQDSLPGALGFYRWCLETYLEQRSNLYHFDQGILNLLALKFSEFFHTFPTEIYNCYPLNPNSTKAKIVHSFGARKLWNDGLLSVCFPEWQRDYETWRSLGGSAYAGPVTNAGLLERGIYPLACDLVEKLNMALEAPPDGKRF